MIAGVSMVNMTEREGVVLVSVKVVPGAAHTRILIMGDRLKVCVSAPAEKGRANKEMIKVLQNFFGVSVRLHAGGASPYKTVALAATRRSVESRLEDL